jgi:hypothetical protein
MLRGEVAGDHPPGGVEHVIGDLQALGSGLGPENARHVVIDDLDPKLLRWAGHDPILAHAPSLPCALTLRRSLGPVSFVETSQPATQEVRTSRRPGRLQGLRSPSRPPQHEIGTVVVSSALEDAPALVVTESLASPVVASLQHTPKDRHQ